MALSRIPFDEISVEDIQGLIENGVTEGIGIDYKRDAYGTSDDDKKEYLRDVSSFANASGGYLIIGVEERGGEPIEVAGISSSNIDAELQRYENLARDSLEPRIIGLRMKAIKLESGNFVLVLSIPQSWNPPHRANFKKTKRFFTRNSTGSHEVSVEELRALFTFSSDLAERIRLFRLQRLGKIKAGVTPFPVGKHGILVIHLVPLASFDKTGVYDLEAAHKSKQFATIDGNGNRRNVNMDGVYFSYDSGDDNREDCAYTQIFRDGIVEAVASGYMISRSEYKNFVPWKRLNRDVFEALPRYLTGLTELEVNAPYAVMISMLNFKDAAIEIGDFFKDKMILTDREDIIAPEVLLQTNKLDGEWHHIIRPSINAIYNAFGLLEAPDFDENGNWKPK